MFENVMAVFGCHLTTSGIYSNPKMEGMPVGAFYLV